MNLVRTARFAGSWYPSNAVALRAKLEGFCLTAQTGRVLGIVAPHAGYTYSGSVAGEVYRRIEVPDLVVVLAPNHTGFGPTLSLFPDGMWETPLGRVEISEDLNQELMVAVPEIEEDILAHENEHAAELQLPFLQFRNPSAKISVIVVGTRRFELLESLGRGIAEAARAIGKPILVVASSDMNHFENQETTERKDRAALDKILALDPRGLHEVVHDKKITMCGFGPTVAMLTYAKEMGAQKAELLRHDTSGTVSGDTQRVVGYAAVTVA